MLLGSCYSGREFTEVNPDKGTETGVIMLFNVASTGNCLQKLTPIRGRKQQLKHLVLLSWLFTEVNPDKGTETLKE